MKILFISPAFQTPSASWSLHETSFLNRKAFMVPLPLATLAGLTPEGIDVELWDEEVQGKIEEAGLEEKYDLVGITGYYIHMRRARVIARVFRERGSLVVAGGPGVSADPNHYRDDFDVIFIGEAERTWPQFLDDFRNGTHKQEYKDVMLPGLEDSPAPRWGNLAASLPRDYVLGAVQITRGCPYRCEFCDVWTTFGNRMRSKPVEQVLDEIRELERLGVRTILFCSDNFIGHRKYAREVLRAVAPLNRSFAKPLSFYTELTLNVAKDDGMLELFADANFKGLLIGIESPNPESLRETNKRHNLFGPIADSVKKIQSYGMMVEASMIVGFDHDGPDIFDQHFEFLQEACVPHPRMHMLKALRGTDLWRRLATDGRIVDLDRVYDAQKLGSDPYPPYLTCNILPGTLSRIKLFEGYLDLLERVYDWNNFAARMKGYLSSVARPSGLAADKISGEFDTKWRKFISSLGTDAQAAIADVYGHAQTCSEPRMENMYGPILRQCMEDWKRPQARHMLLEQIQAEKEMDVESYKVSAAQ